MLIKKVQIKTTKYIHNPRMFEILRLIIQSIGKDVGIARKFLTALEN